MKNEKDLVELSKDLAKDTKELAKEHLEKEIDEEGIAKVVKAIFVGIFDAVKKAF
ncbi:MAG: hypothetical protein AB7G93_04565 [Bdellovibrionales bacterium]